MARPRIARWTRLVPFLFALGLLASCQPAEQVPPGAEEDTLAPMQQPDTAGLEF